MNYFEDLDSVVKFRRLRSLFVLLCVLCGNSLAQEWKTVADGVEYAQVRREFSGKAVDINLLRLDLKKVRLDVHHAMDMAIGTEKTSSIATRHGAFAAINAGFFRLDKSEFAGDNVDTLVINNKLLSEPVSERTAIGISNGARRTEVTFNQWRFVGYVKWNTQSDIDILKGFNRELKDNDLVVFTPEFGKNTQTNPTALEIIVRKNKVSDINSGNSVIPRDGFVLSGQGEILPFLKKFKVGDSVTLEWDIITREKPKATFPVEDIVAGVPQLIKNGKIDITWEQEKASKSFVETRHPRTAVAKLKDGKFLMLTADGRSEQSAGLDLYDLAKYMLELGAVDAMNLDGGGSTTMFLDGKVVNHPSDKDGERKVGDAILVTLRKKLQKPAR